MGEGFVQADMVVPTATRPGKAGAGGCECGEAEACQHTSTPNIPWIGNDEAAGLMQPSERVDFMTLHQTKPTSGLDRTAAMINTLLHSVILLLWGMSPSNAAPPH